MSIDLDNVALEFGAFADQSPFAIALIDGEERRVYRANDSFWQTCGWHPLVPEDYLIDAQTTTCECGPGLRALSSLVRDVHATGVAKFDIEIDEVIAGRDDVAWSVSAWPMAVGAPTEAPLALIVRSVGAEVRARRMRAHLVQELREINEQLVLSTLREEELRVQAEAASSAKSAFVATMSHELRTPLAAILGYAELLANGYSGDVTASQAAQLKRILANANHLLSIIDEILTFASLETGRVNVQLERIDVQALIENTVLLVTPLIDGKQLQFRVSVPDESIHMLADSLKTRQILVNLLGNAVKFTEKGTVELVARVHDRLVVIEVRDTGIGIAPQHIEKVFDAFWQVRDGPARKVGGTGLGLNVSRNLALQMGGDISVESMVGQGSIFRLTLPLASPDEPATT